MMGDGGLLVVFFLACVLFGSFVFSIVVASLFVVVLPGTGRWCRWVMLVLAGIIGGTVGVVFLFFWEVIHLGAPDWAPVAVLGFVVVAQITGLIVGAEKYFGGRGDG